MFSIKSRETESLNNQPVSQPTNKATHLSAQPIQSTIQGIKTATDRQSKAIQNPFLSFHSIPVVVLPSRKCLRKLKIIYLFEQIWRRSKRQASTIHQPPICPPLKTVGDKNQCRQVVLTRNSQSDHKSELIGSGQHTKTNTFWLCV